MSDYFCEIHNRYKVVSAAGLLCPNCTNDTGTFATDNTASKNQLTAESILKLKIETKRDLSNLLGFPVVVNDFLPENAIILTVGKDVYAEICHLQAAQNAEDGVTHE